LGATPLVTVGIPFFDEERLLGDAVRAILAQTVTDLEILLVDDGSNDRSLEIARSFRDPRITVLSDGRSRHLPARLNEIARRARAPFVARMDADDVCHPTRIAEQLAVARAEPACDCVGTWAAIAREDGAPLGVVESALPATAASAIERGILVHASVLCRRAWILAHPYDESLTRAEDRELWCRTAGTSVFAVVPRCLYVVRVSPRGPRFLDDYVEAQRQNRRIFARYGPRASGIARTARLLAVSLGKAAAMRALVRCGLGDVAVGARGRAPSADERALVAEALAAAQPG
jgi:glycosyltransferase involved in cell wall biosynthesis